MSNEAIKLARAVKTVKGGAKHQLLLLADHANKDWECWPSQQTLANDQGVSLDTVQRRNAELEKAELITRSSRYPKAKPGRLNDRYALNRKAMELAAEGSTPQNAAKGLHRNLPESTPQSCGLHKDEPSLEPSDCLPGSVTDDSLVTGQTNDHATGQPDDDAWFDGQDEEFSDAASPDPPPSQCELLGAEEAELALAA
jgi:DNA-binding transcriptional MocR family regulator